MDASFSEIADPVAKPIRTILLFGLLGLVAHHLSSPWWEGEVLAVHPQLPEPSGAFVEPPETRETVEEKLATVDLEPSETEASSSEPNSTAPGASIPATDEEDEEEAAPSTDEPESSTAIADARPDPADFDLLDSIRELDDQLDDPPTPLSRPCLNWDPSYLDRSVRPLCRRRALDSFFAKLRDVALDATDEPVRFTQLGDSLVAGDDFTGELRRLMQKQFGAAGFGYINVGKASQFTHTRNLSTDRRRAWDKRDVIHDPQADTPFGLAGISFEPAGRPTLDIRPHGEGRGRKFDRVGLLYYRRRSSLAVRLNVGGEGRDVDLSGPADANAVTWVDVEPGAQRLKVAGFDRGGYFYGILLERSAPGVVVDNLGVSSGRVPRLRFIDADQWRTQIRKRGADAVSFAYGVNSVGEHKASDAWLTQYADQYTSILETANSSSEEVGCLVISILTRGQMDDGRLTVANSVEPLLRRQRRAARRADCAFWNAHEAMGGEAGARRWYNNTPQLLGADLTHPTGNGYIKLANLFYASLIREFRRYLDERIRRAHIPPLREIDEADASSTASPLPERPPSRADR